jgi:hypothetical protein
MKFTLGLFALWATVVLGQQAQECTRELARTDDCASVINANACYNKQRFRNKQTLQCIDGKDDAEKAKKVRYNFCINAVRASKY